MARDEARPVPQLVEEDHTWKVNPTGSVWAAGAIVGQDAAELTAPQEARPCSCGANHARSVRLRTLLLAKYPHRAQYGDWAEEAAAWARAEALAERAGITLDPMVCPGKAAGMVEGMKAALESVQVDTLRAQAQTFRLTRAERRELDGPTRAWLAEAPPMNVNDGTDGKQSAWELAEWLRAHPQPCEEEESEEGGPEVPDEEVDGLEWGAMTTQHPTTGILTSARLRRRRSIEEGDVIRDATRLHLDGRIFRSRTRRPPAGSLLVDTSGSMAWDAQRLLEVVDRAPAALVAAYAGDGHRHGNLRIVARGGRRCADELVNPPGRGNEVDGPALEWLGRQKRPRVWLSDGQACATRYPAVYAIPEAARLAQLYSITRVGDLRQAIDAITRRR